MNVFISLLGVVATIAFYYFWTFNYWKKRGVQTLSSNLLFGNLTDVVFRRIPIYRMFKEVYETCKVRGDKFMGFYFLNKPTLVIVDPELIKQVLIKDFNNFTDRPFHTNEKDPLTIHIASAKGTQWRKMREQLSPAFTPSKMKNVCQTLLQVGDQMKSVLDKFEENCQVVDLKDVTSKYLVDAIGMGIFGIECNTLKNLNIEFRDFAENTFGGSFGQSIKVVINVLCPSILHLLRIPFHSTKIQNFYLNLVKSTVEHREKNNVVRKDLMHSLIQLRNNIDIEDDNKLNLDNVSENEKSLKIEEITAQALVLFGAAYETSLSTISLCIYELASNEDVQNNLRKEITSILGKYDGEIDYDVIMEMIYLDKCISETLRKYAVVAMITRFCTEKYHLPNTDIVLDVGTALYIPSYEIHQDPEYYPNPNKFDPERFSPVNKSMRPNCTFLSFGEGNRNCLGVRLGLLLVKISVITFLSNYNFIINCKVKLPPPINKNSAIIGLEYPLYLNIKKI